MQQRLVTQGYPLFVLELSRAECRFEDLGAICAYLRACIEGHRCTRFIADFDHYAHTAGLPEGEIGPGIRAARNLIFCFGIALPEPAALGLRPRSIGVAETETGFVISFMETPMPLANAAMEDWVRELARTPDRGGHPDPHRDLRQTVVHPPNPALSSPG